MAIVVDSSVTMAWCFADETSPLTDAVLQRVRTEGAVMPAIWPLEVANVLLVAERRGRITQAAAERFIALLQALAIAVDYGVLATARGPTMALGRQHNLSAYDAAYLEVAQRRGLLLATVDGRLSAAAAAMGLSLVA